MLPELSLHVPRRPITEFSKQPITLAHLFCLDSNG
jgi:hypothetical protein